ncbi:MAG: DUF1800 family protein [Acidimicrobiales bacterium]
MDTHAAQVAHILRRTSFGIRPRVVRSHSTNDIHDLIDERLADEGWALDKDQAEERDLEDVEYDTLQREWLERMLSPEAGLHERMVWYWHDHFTTSRHETSDREMWRQHHLVRRHALGNFRDLARGMLTDGAMLHYLDGAGSRGDAPNENLSREFLELFTAGRNAGYTEDDVRAGARILSGWWVDWDTGEVGFSSEDSYNRPVTFLGVRRRWTIDQYLDAVLALPSVAEHVASRIHAHFVAIPLTETRRAELGSVLRSNDWEIRPLMAEILHGDDFLAAAGSRTRQPVEWLIGAAMAFDFDSLDELEFELWQLQAAGQSPFEPPNVAGWAEDDRWSSATQVMARANTLLNWEVPTHLIDSVEPTVDAVLEHTGLHDVSGETRQALNRAIDTQTEYDRGLEVLLVLTLLSPEFATI